MESAYSERVLKETPPRVLAYFTGLRDKKIFQAVVANGLSTPFLAVGRSRLLAVLGGEAPPVPDPDAGDDADFTEIVQWDERHFAVLKAAMAFYSPESADWVFDELSPQPDQVGSIRVIATAMKRLGMVLSGHPDAPEAPPELAEGLEALGYGAAERERVAELLESSVSPEEFHLEPEEMPELDDTADEPADELPTNEDYLAALTELRRWYDLAAAIARRSNLSRYQLIRLGLARRKKATS